MSASLNKAIELLLTARNDGIDLVLADGQLQVKVPRNKTVAPQLLEEIRNNKKSIIDFLIREELKEPQSNPVRRRADRDLSAPLPLSFAQERLWFIDRFGGSVPYHLSWVYRVGGSLDAEALRDAFRAVLDRHEVLRTVVAGRDGIGAQEVKAFTDWDFSYATAAALDTQAVAERIQDFIDQPFDLAHDPMLRALLVTSAGEWLLVVVVHHIAFDGWSIGVLVRELAALYNSRMAGTVPDLPLLPVQYADYALWQREFLSGPSFAARLAYWKQALTGVEPLDLLTDHARPSQAGTGGGLVEQRLGADTRGRLLRLAQSGGATSFMVLLAAFKALLHRYTGQDDICVGTPIAGRDIPEVEHLVGFFVNTLALRTQLSGDDSFNDLLQSVRTLTLEAFEYKDVPFEKVVEVLGVERDPARNPVFQVMFSMQNEATDDDHGFSGLTLTQEKNWTLSAKVDLHLNVALTPQGLDLSLVYRSDLFEAVTAERMLAHYGRLLEALLQQPQRSIGDIDILSDREREELIRQGTNSVCAFPLDTNIAGLVAAHARRAPGATAMIDDNGSLTYAELNESAGRLAAYLNTQGVRAGDRVAVCLDRSTELGVALLAIMQAGAAYVPIDPAYPAERIRYMLDDSQVKALLLPDLSHRPEVIDLPLVIGLREIKNILEQQSVYEAPRLLPQSIAYVIYTSGSTGQPKGVSITHAGLNNLAHWHMQAFDVDADSRATAMAGIGFDAFGWELWPYLAAGASVRFVSNEQRLSLPGLVALLGREGITHSFVATAMAADLVQASAGQALSLAWLLTGGDRLMELPSGRVGYRIVNNYGPTENTVVATSNTLPSAGGRLPYPIGRPIANVQAYVLDRRLQLSLPGIAGELCLGGVQLATGYLDRPALTGEKFIDHTFTDMPGARLYRTGDKVRWLPDGNLEYLGRMDEQVKLRGYRIEPGEIEHALQQAPGIRQAVVLLHEGAGQTELVGFIVADSWDEAAVVDFLQQRLPAYMVPALLQEVKEIPLTPNGKIDRACLLNGLQRTGDSVPYEAPRTLLEVELAACWQKLLGRERIGIRDHFFNLGGHSLLAMRLSAALRTITGIDLPVRKIFEHPTIAGLAACVQFARQAALPPVSKAGPQERMPLSYEQERLWFIDRLHGSSQYHVPWVLRMTGIVSADRLEQAFRALLDRHQVLRTVIRESAGAGYQHLTSSADWRLQQWTAEEASARHGSLQEGLEEFIRQPFDLSSDAPIRVLLVRCAENDYLLAGVVHHIAFDGWSTGILVRELAAYYAGDDMPAPLPIQYSDYAVWQRAYLSGVLLERKLAYWRTQLQGVAPLDLLTDFPRPANPSVRGDFVTAALDATRLQQLRRLSQEEGVTLFMTMLTAFKVLLHRYTGQQDICVGTPVAGRQQQELEGLIGFFLNTLALRSEVLAGMSFRELLQQVKQTTLDAYEHQEVPFEKIVETLGVPRDRSRSAVFQVWMVLQNMPAAGALDLGDVTLRAEQPGAVTAQFDLNLDIAESEEGLQLSLTYCSDLYRRETAIYLLDHYVQLLSAIVADRSAILSSLPLVGEEERALIEGYGGSAAPAIERTLTESFDAQATLNFSSIALRYDRLQLTYGELQGRVDKLARSLAALGVRRGTRIGLCLHKGPELITGLLAILKAGAAYVPIDPEYPAERIAYMVSDSRCPLVLTAPEHHHLFEPGTVLINTDAPGAVSEARMPEAPLPTDPAYIIYTSGSTGRPKGVLVAHRAVSSLIASQQKTFGITPDERILQFSNTCFDASVEQIFLALLSGATLVLLPKRIQLDLPAFEALLDEEAITHLHATPGFLELVSPRAYAALRRVIAGGEACRSTLARRWSGIVDFYNEYGPTETTVTATELLVDDTYLYGETLPIGRPLAHVETHLLQADGQLAGIGMPAELYLGGTQLAEEYINLPERTAESFVHIDGQRLYRTGDRARWTPDGNIEFLGRADDQVKIRGYRIEPAEIEAVLEEAAGVQKAVVLVQEEGREKRLVAFVVSDYGFDREAILSFARSRLPEYMMPAAVVETDKIPLNSNGKVDRKKLLESFELAPAAQGYEAPRDATETIMADIWQELLEVERVGIHDNFFELGGHSLLAVRVAAATRSRLDREIAIVALFEHPTVALLCAQLPAAAGAPVLPPIVRQPRTGRIPLSFSQERLWFIDKLQGSVQYHMPWVFRLEGRLDAGVLEASFRAIVDRHEVLRTVIREEEGQGYQHIVPAGDWTLQRTKAEEIETLGLSLDDYIRRQISKPYDLSADSLLKVTLVRQSAQEHVLLVLLHHIAFDGWSISVMVKELAELYNSLQEGRAATLTALPVQYADYAFWQHAWLSGSQLEGQLAFWKNKLAGAAPLELPLDHPRPAVQSTQGRTLGFTVEIQLLERLRALSKEQGATLFMTLSAAFKVLLHRYTGQDDICIGTPVANRMQSSTDALIGFFVNTLVLRDDLAGDPLFTDLLRQVRTTALEAYAHQDTPFEKVVEAVAAERSMSYTPLFQVLFALQNTPQVPDLDLAGLRLIHTALENTTAKFDLYVDLLETPEGLQVQIEYATALFEPATITRLFDHYCRLLQAVAEEPAQKISRLPMLTPVETASLLRVNDTATEFPVDASIIGLFEAQAAQTPQALAVAYGTSAVSYASLNEQANQLAHHLASRGAGPGKLVVVCLDRSIEMIVSVLAVLKAGTAYVPVDPHYPRERIAWMLNDARAALVITDTSCVQLLGDVDQSTVLNLDAERTAIAQHPKTNPGISPNPEDLVYVIYTSGSTGRPKGVELPHRALINLLLWQRGQNGHFGPLRILQFASLNFDVSFQEIFSALCFGNSLHLIEEDRRKDMHEVVADINSQQLTTLFIPYVVLKNLAEYVAATGTMPLSLREIVTAGEQLKLTADIQALVRKTGLRLVNQYGPSEAHVVSAYEVQEEDFHTRVLPPIGRPIANTQLHILGRHGEPCAPGIAGELHIGGVQVARGYLGQEALTQEKFIADPFSPGARLYRTGDKARWLPDGNIEFLGRLDDQVKIHGYRIELGEVEAALQQTPGVRQAVVLAREDNRGTQRLVAYVAGHAGIDREAVLHYLKKVLPAYMVPSLLVLVDEIPLTANGKADKRRLPDVETGQLTTYAYVPPRTDTEQRITAIWRELLGLAQVGVHDQFFEIGGHSLLVTRLASAIRKDFGLDLPVRSFFELTTPEALAAYVDVNRLPATYDADLYEAIQL